MSQCCPRKCRPAVIALLGLTIFLESCSVATLKGAASNEGISSNSNSSAPSFRRIDEPEILEPASIITGGLPPFSGILRDVTNILVGSKEPIHFKQPVAVSGYANSLYVVDGEGGTEGPVVFRYDLIDKTIETIGKIGINFKGDPMGIYVAPDLGFYIADPDGKKVLHFDKSGKLLQTFQDIKNLSRPVDVVVDENSGDVFIADGSYSHIVVFNKVATPVYAIGARGTGPGRFRAITALAKGPNGLYVADRIELPVQELALGGKDSVAGAFRYSLGEGDLIWPTAIALDKNNRVYVSDKSDNTIKIFDDIRLLATVGGGGAAPGRFRLITDMWMSDDGYLYVADSLNRRVQVFRVIPEREQRQRAMTLQ